MGRYRGEHSVNTPVGNNFRSRGEWFKVPWGTFTVSRREHFLNLCPVGNRSRGERVPTGVVDVPHGRGVPWGTPVGNIRV